MKRFHDAKWMLDDPRINFAISTRGGKPGVDHLGFQTDDPGEACCAPSAPRGKPVGIAVRPSSSCC